MKSKEIDGKMHYDSEYDIAYFGNNNPYDVSLETEDLVIDFDQNNSVKGIEIFDASHILSTSKEQLEEVKEWKLNAEVEENKVSIKLEITTEGGKKVLERQRNLTNHFKNKIPNSKTVCAAN